MAGFVFPVGYLSREVVEFGYDHVLGLEPRYEEGGDTGRSLPAVRPIGATGAALLGAGSLAASRGVTLKSKI